MSAKGPVDDFVPVEGKGPCHKMELKSLLFSTHFGQHHGQLEKNAVCLEFVGNCPDASVLQTYIEGSLIERAREGEKGDPLSFFQQLRKRSNVAKHFI